MSKSECVVSTRHVMRPFFRIESGPCLPERP